MSDKIHSQHLARKAMLYVRQSSAFQVTHNRESQKLQYAMQTRVGCELAIRLQMAAGRGRGNGSATLLNGCSQRP